MKIDKKIILAFLIISIYTLGYDLLKLFNVVKMTEYHARTFNIFFSLLASIVFILLVKNKYWILANVFDLLHSISRIVAAFLFKPYQPINLRVASVMIAGLLLELMAAYYFYKLFQVKDFTFMENLRLNDLDDYLKKKSQSRK